MSTPRFGSYGAIAALCIVLHFAIMMTGDTIGVHYVFSTTVSFVTCVLVGYTLHSRYSFSVSPRRGSLARYTTAMALNFPLSIVTVWFFFDLLKQPMVIAAPASTLTGTVYNYLTSRWAISGRTLARP